MLMSKSRLEKFLYALYSLDSSDLPKPLSRIEELYKCLVTGEEPPTFEPLSRVEKYLMAILGVYDVNELPNPLSRVEVLLYKLAAGDDNLDDVKSFLSEHEELLAEIIRNGGVGGNIDIEYVLYTLSTGFNTLYNTAEKPVKSAILKGQTLVNLINGGEVTKNAINNWVVFSADFNADMIKTSTDYTLITYVISNTLSDGSGCDFGVSGGLNDGLGFKAIRVPSGKVGVYKIKLTTKNVFSQPPVLRQQIFNDVATGSITFKQVLVEGDYTDVDVPYFEGMQSVKMPVLKAIGKNLLNPNDVKYYPNGKTTNMFMTNKIKPNTDYIISFDNNGVDWSGSSFYLRRKDNSSEVYIPTKNATSNGRASAHFNFTEEQVAILNNEGYLQLYCTKVPDESLKPSHIQIEESLIATSYEPFKSNILTVNEDVTLRGIGDVKDELNLLTGELTQRIGEVVFDGSEKWVNNVAVSGLSDTHIGFKTEVSNGVNTISQGMTTLCDKFMYSSDYHNSGEICKGVSNSSAITIVIKKERLTTHDLNGFKSWLQANNLKVQYPLATESIKTVDLSIVNQDGNDTKLSTFDDITHVTLSSEGLIPEAELEVATKNEEVLSTLSLEMDDISTAQTTLEETSNAQSENVDATMIATTEIYEGLL